MSKRERDEVQQQPEEQKLPVAVITRSDTTLFVNFPDDDEEPDRLGIAEALDTLEYKSIVMANGEIPRGKTCRALLKCDRGSLVFDDQKYKTRVAATRGLPDCAFETVGQNNAPRADIQPDVPDPPESSSWRDFERTGESEPIFKRYIRFALHVDCNLHLDRSTAQRVEISILDEKTGPSLLRRPAGEPFSVFAGLREGNVGEQSVLVKIEHAHNDVDGVYFVKSTTNLSLWRKELFVSGLLKERTNHSSFLGARFGFRYRKEARNDAQEYYALAIPFHPSWSVARLLKLPQLNIDSLGDVLTPTQLMRCLYSVVDALLSAHPDRVRGNFAIDFRHCDLHPGNVLIGIERNVKGQILCWLIEFSHADVFYSERNIDTGEFERKHLVGSTPRRDQELYFVATSASKDEVGLLIRMWCALLRRFHYETESSFLETQVGECRLARTQLPRCRHGRIYKRKVG